MAEVGGLELEVRGEVRGRLDPGVGDGGDHRGVDHVVERRRGERVEPVGDRADVPGRDRAHDDHDDEQRQPADRDHRQPPLAVAAGEARDVERRDHGDHPAGDDQLRRRLAELAPDRRQVVGHRDRRQGDHEHEVEQDRPAGDEAHQLVERVAREGRGAAALAEHRAALDVGERVEDERDPGGEEDQRGQPEPAVRDHADREVDGEADRRERRREQPGHAEEPPRHAGADGQPRQVGS